ncbi:p-hydroxyphenylacetate 3-hydroxylase, reductase component [Rickettsiales bacterium Ac37b]|nr:p-hydroxyphenylacetate 3-hydroxylase, reductase component [Rickettsiales bacterium Ac37b]
MILEPLQFKKALSNFTTGVVVITAMTQDREKIGVTITSFTSLSLDPPLVLFCLSNKSYSIKYFKESKYFNVNILAQDQEHIAYQFAYMHGADKWHNINISMSKNSNLPVIDDCIAYIECEKYQESIGGDHIIFMGKVMNFVSVSSKLPLARFQGKYSTLLEKGSDERDSR